jgi:S-adenosylmethionine decarboxylase proenzyme
VRVIAERAIAIRTARSRALRSRRRSLALSTARAESSLDHLLQSPPRVILTARRSLGRDGWKEVVELNTRGRHLLVEYTGCDASVLDDLKRIEALMNEAARAAQTNIVASVFQPFEPQGVTGVVVVEESHLSIHTWPECGYAAVDFFTCGDSLPERAHEVLCAGLRAQYAAEAVDPGENESALARMVS